MHRKKREKVGKNLEKVEEVVWMLAVSPSWWFKQMPAMGVVISVIFSLQIRTFKFL